MARGTAYVTTAKNGNVQYYIRDKETELYYSNIGETKEDIIMEFKEIEKTDTHGNKELGIRAIKDARVRTNIMLALPNDMDNEKCLQHLKNIIEKTPIKDCQYIIAIHKGENGEVEKNKHAHLIYNERNTKTNKKDRRFKDKDYFKKLLVEYKNEFGFEQVEEHEYKRGRIHMEDWKEDPEGAREDVKEWNKKHTHQDEIKTPAEAHHQDETIKLVQEPSKPAAATEVTASVITPEPPEKQPEPPAPPAPEPNKSIERIKEIPDDVAFELKYEILAIKDDINKETKNLCTKELCDELKAPHLGLLPTMDQAHEWKDKLSMKRLEALEELRDRPKPLLYIVPKVKTKWDTKKDQDYINIKKLFESRFNIIDIIIKLLSNYQDCEDLKKHYGKGIRPEIRNSFNTFHDAEALNLYNKHFGNKDNYHEGEIKKLPRHIQFIVDFREDKLKKKLEPHPEQIRQKQAENERVQQRIDAFEKELTKNNPIKIIKKAYTL